MSDVSRISTENMNDYLVARINAIEDLSGLNTEDQTSFVNALNEVLGKLTIVSSIGSPLSTNDKWVDMGAKIDEIVEELRVILKNRGIRVRGEVLLKLIRLIPDIPEDAQVIIDNMIEMLRESIGSPVTEDDTVVDMCEKIDTMTQDFRDKLTEKGVILEGDEKISELVAKVDDVGSEGEVIEHIIPDKWETKANMPKADGLMAGASFNDKIYVIGGHSNLINTNYCYDTTNNSWVAKTNAPISQCFGQVVERVGDYIYSIGTYYSQQSNYGYSITQDTWTTMTNMKTGRNYAASAMLNDKIYVLGGGNANSDPKTINECYDPSTNTWTTKAPMLYSSLFLSATECGNNNIYVCGGLNTAGAQEKTMLEYDATLDSWTSKTSLPAPRHSSAMESIGTKVYIISGIVDNAISTDSLIFDTETNKYEAIKQPQVASTRPSIAKVDDKIYIIGGSTDYSSENKTNRNECYSPEIIEYEHRPSASVQALVNTIGEPCTIEDSVYDICDKLEIMTDNLRDELEHQGIEVIEEEKLNSLIEKVSRIGFVQPTEPLYIYNNGVVNEEIGIKNVGTDYWSTLEFNEDHIYLKCQGVNDTATFACLITVNAIELMGYRKMYIETTWGQQYAWYMLGFSEVNDTVENVRANAIKESGRVVTEMNFNIWKGYPYILIETNWLATAHGVLQIKKIWLEP